MKKRIIAIIFLLVTFALCLTACGDEYTVVFFDNGKQVAEVTLAVGETPSATDYPEIGGKKGYTGTWQEYDFSTAEDGQQIEIKVIYKPNKYKANLDLNGGTSSVTSIEVEFDSTVNLSEKTRGLVTKKDCAFDGWVNASGEKVKEFKWRDASDLTFTAVWACDIAFKQEGADDIVYQVREGSNFFDEYDIPSIVQVAGYNSVWDLTGIDLTSVTKHTIVNLKKTPKDYTVTYNVNGGDALTPNTATVTYNEYPTLSEPTRSGYTFMGWYYEDEKIENGNRWQIADNVTVTAKWGHEITFKQSPTLSTPVWVEDGGTLVCPQVPASALKTGYTVEWDLTGIDVNNITQSEVIELKETANEYTLTYNVNGGDALTPNTVIVTFDAKPSLVTPTRAGHKFLGWYVDNENNLINTDNAWKIAGNITITAKWEELAVGSYTVTFIQDGISPKTYIVTGTNFYQDRDNNNGIDPLTDLPTLTAVTGYGVSWNLDGIDLTNISDDLTITAIKTAKSYTVKYNLNYTGATPIADGSATYNQIPTLVTPTRDGFEFMGWYYNSVEIDTDKVWDKDIDNIELVAKWGHKVTFEQTSSVEDVYVEEGGTLVCPQITDTKKGYKLEWNLDGVDLENITQNLTITLKQTAKQFTLRFNTNGADEIDDMNVTYDQKITLPKIYDDGTLIVKYDWLYNQVVLPSTEFVWNYDAEDGATIIINASWEPSVGETEEWSGWY